MAAAGSRADVQKLVSSDEGNLPLENVCGRTRNEAEGGRGRAVQGSQAVAKCLHFILMQ